MRDGKYEYQHLQMEDRAGLWVAPAGYTLFSGNMNRLKDVCEKAKIRWRRALCRWERWGGKSRPIYCGVLVSRRAAAKVQDEIAKREQADAARASRKIERMPPVLTYLSRREGGPIRQRRLGLYSRVAPAWVKIHPEEMAFWASLRTDACDDTAWLVYADWLQDHGDDETAADIRRAIADQVAASTPVPETPHPSGLTPRPITRRPTRENS